MIVPTDNREMFCAEDFPPPRHDKLICGNSKLGITTFGRFQPGFHDCWDYAPKFPKKLKERRDSPCIGYCSTALGDAVCLGCGRTQQEVDGWVSMSEDEKQAVWKRLEARNEEPRNGD